MTEIAVVPAAILVVLVSVLLTTVDLDTPTGLVGAAEGLSVAAVPVASAAALAIWASPIAGCVALGCLITVLLLLISTDFY